MLGIRKSGQNARIAVIAVVSGLTHKRGGRGSIALFTVNFSHLHYKVIQRGYEAISG